MAYPTYQLVVDIRDQLTVAQASWHAQPMVETQEIRDAFAARLNEALDRKDGVRKGRGRNVDLQAGLKSCGLVTTTQATSKWLRAESMPEKDNMRMLAAWLGVSAQWLEYGEGDLWVTPDPDLDENEFRESADHIRKIAQGIAEKYSVEVELYRTISTIRKPLALMLVLEFARAASEDRLPNAALQAVAEILARHKTNPGSIDEKSAVPRGLEGLAKAAHRTLENGDNPDDMLRMLEHGMNKQYAKEGVVKHEGRKKRSN